MDFKIKLIVKPDLRQVRLFKWKAVVLVAIIV